MTPKPKRRELGHQRRAAARLAAVQGLYEMDIADAGADPVLAGFLVDRWGQIPETEGLPKPDPEYLDGIVRGVMANLPRLDQAIAGALAAEWTLERLEALLRAILRAGAYELCDRPEVPTPVVITEYVDLAHTFFSGKEPSLVHAVLDRAAAVLRPQGASEEAG